MFYDAESFNQPLNNFATTKVTTMFYMFNKARKFNQMLYWDTSSVTNMRSMFYQADAFNQPLYFNTSSVVMMYGMFLSADRFNQSVDFVLSSVRNASKMFNRARALDQDLCHWGSQLQGRNVDVSGMFRLAESCPCNVSDPDLHADPPGPFCYKCSDQHV